MTSQRVKKKKKVRHKTKSSGVTVDLLQYTHTEKCNLFVLYNTNSNGLLKDFRGMKKENL